MPRSSNASLRRIRPGVLDDDDMAQTMSSCCQAREGECIFQPEEAWMTIKHEDTIVQPFVLRQFLHNTASRRISQDGRSMMFHFGVLGHLDLWE